MSTLPEREAVGTLMRHVLELLDGDVATVYRDAGVPDYRPRFSPPSGPWSPPARCRSAPWPAPSA
ncbi:hypothetical protein [Phytohabitans rumicis]|uniref:Uncharacterized protein n=1 Tax=Phytohabitans rumicis TaxID=1076125 RepID=A0A6V8LSM5_9ACTN|nr:hypothetical protein [Phytohabitans rumicis]GFJ95745.1 hypothetical protein Prum_093870 [Phytohabitans rumicis]